MQDYVGCITTEVICDCYLGPYIENELISMKVFQIKKLYIRLNGKYFSVILCTSDLRHQEQMAIVLWYIFMYTEEVKVTEDFVEFIPVQDNTGKGLWDFLLAAVVEITIHISNCRDEQCDKGQNMKAHIKGVEVCILRINCSTFFTPWVCLS
jgi:hypothetical protein